MSMQEGASSGSFQPNAPQPGDTRDQEPPAAPPISDVDLQSAASPFSGAAYDIPIDAAPYTYGEPGLRPSRRRAWSVVGLAIVVPAAIAGVIVWQLLGDDNPATSVSTVEPTTQAETTTSDAATATPTPVTVTTDGSATETAEATESESGATVAAASGSTQESAQSGTTTQAETVDLSHLTPAERLVAWQQMETIQVLPGETLWVLAQSYGTTVSAIAALNDITDTSTLSVGQELVIPVNFAEEIEVGAVAAIDQADTAETTESGAGDSTVASLSADQSATLDEWTNIATITINDGDSLEGIAIANGTTVAAIMALNDIANSNLIYVGDTIQVPVGFQGATPVAVVDTSSETAGDSTQQEPSVAATEPATEGDEMEEANSDAPVDELEGEEPAASTESTGDGSGAESGASDDSETSSGESDEDVDELES